MEFSTQLKGYKALRNDGKVFQMCNFQGKDLFEDTLTLCEWLFPKTQYGTTRDMVVSFLASYTNRFDDGWNSLSDQLLQKAYQIPEYSVTPSFVESLCTEINQAELVDLGDLCTTLVTEFSQEFCLFNGWRDRLDFIISSSDFDWFDWIRDVVDRCRDSELNITIRRGNILDGGQDLYLNHENNIVKDIHRDNFLKLNYTPVEDIILPPCCYKKYDGKNLGYREMNSMAQKNYTTYTNENFSK